MDTPDSPLDTLPPLKEVIATHDLRADKKLGQNFLLDQNITDKIVRGAVNISGVHALEIGPGPGGLTRSILRANPASLTAIEYDPRAVKALQDLRAVAPSTLTIIQGDALKHDLTTLCPQPRCIIANLPYNIATPLLIKWLHQIYDDPAAFAHMTLMFQKEVADRITASPSTKAYGRLSVLCQWLCSVKNIYTLPPSAFTPPPKIMSAVVHFTPKPLGLPRPNIKTVEAVTETAFGQRRKMIRSSMKTYLPAIEKLGIDPTLRAENLSVDQFIQIAHTHETL